MKFKTRTPFDVALDAFLKVIVPIEDTEVLPIREARGRVLARQVIAQRDEPNYFGRGDVVVEPGHQLRPADIGLLASLEVRDVTVYRRPVVTIIPTGEEIVKKGPSEGEVVEIDGLITALLVEQWGARYRYRNIVTDARELIEAALLRDIDADLILTTGGTSVGIRDLVPEAVRKLGKLLVHGIAISPAKPTALGLVESTPVACLPGFPVACLVASYAFVKPAVYRLAHFEHTFERTVTGILASKIMGKPGSRTYARVAIRNGRVEPIMVSGSGILSSMAKADGFVVIPENVEGYDKGQKVEVVLFD